MASTGTIDTLLNAYDRAWRRAAAADVEMAWVGSFTEAAAEEARKEHKAAHAILARVQETTRWEVDDLYVNEALDTVLRAMAVSLRRDLWGGPGAHVALDHDDFYFTCAIAKCAGPRADMATADSYGPCTVKTGEYLPREY